MNEKKNENKMKKEAHTCPGCWRRCHTAAIAQAHGLGAGYILKWNLYLRTEIFIEPF